MSDNGMERKILPFKLTAFDGEGRTMEGYASTFGNVDEGGDIVHQGAFAKTIRERGHKVKFLWQHDTREPIGKPIEMREDERGLFISALISDTARGRDALALLKDGAISEMSIGYDAIKGGTDFTTMEDGEQIRNLREVKLYEFSLVSFPMNEAATVTALKEDVPSEGKPWSVFPMDGEFCVFKIDDEGNRVGDSLGCHGTSADARAQVRALFAAEDTEEDGKGASGSTSLPIADRDRAWDASAARSRVRTATNSTDEPSASYKNAFFWFDAANSDTFGAYKLPFADVINGKLTAVPRGVFAAAGAVSGARGGVDIPSGDKSGVQSRISRYYSRMRKQFDDDSIIPPWDKSIAWEQVQAKMVAYYESADVTEPTGSDVKAATLYAFTTLLEEKVGRAITEPDLMRLTDITMNLTKFLEDYDVPALETKGEPKLAPNIIINYYVNEQTSVAEVEPPLDASSKEAEPVEDVPANEPLTSEELDRTLALLELEQTQLSLEV